MNKKVFILGLVALLAISGIIASNMGFKLNYRLNAVTPSVSLSGTNTLALPYNRQFGIDTALQLIGDLGAANVTYVANFVEATDGYDVYTGVKGSPDPDGFNLGGGTAVFVKMAAGVDYIVVGSHQPGMGISLDAPGAGSLTGSNFYAPPYHNTATTALAMIGDIGAANVVYVANFVEATDGFEVYTGVKGSPDPDGFAIVPGKGYFVKMLNTVNYVPSHY